MDTLKDIKANDKESLDISRAYVPSEEQLKYLLKSVSGSRYPERNLLILCLSYYAGLRCSEIAALRIEDVYYEDGDIKASSFILGKGRKKREIYLNAKPTQKALLEYYKQLSSERIFKYKNEVLFLNQSKCDFDAMGMCKVLKSIHRSGNLPQCSSHSGRRYFISKVIYKTGNVGLAKQYAGHSDIRTTLLYFEDNPLIKREVVADIWR